MANMPHKFKDRDVQRVIKAARSAGLDPAAVEVDPNTGKIKVMGKLEPPPSGSDLDNWLRCRNGAWPCRP